MRTLPNRRDVSIMQIMFASSGWGQVVAVVRLSCWEFDLATTPPDIRLTKPWPVERAVDYAQDNRDIDGRIGRCRRLAGQEKRCRGEATDTPLRDGFMSRLHPLQGDEANIRAGAAG